MVLEVIRNLNIRSECQEKSTLIGEFVSTIKANDVIYD